MSGDEEYFKTYYKMTPEKFEELHLLVEEPLTRLYVVREPLPSRSRLAMTLRLVIPKLRFPFVKKHIFILIGIVIFILTAPVAFRFDFGLWSSFDIQDR